MDSLQKFLAATKSKPELVILVLMVTIIAMLLIPMPTPIMDLLLGLNVVISLLIFMGSFYIERILQFSTFPSILLITTLFRLALTISTSRLILLQADAGDIVSTFGQFVIGDSLAVGFVVFSIVTVVQFIVITKGSERVAEVAARFSLDGMPGKQMSIDSDLKAGIIDADGAKERRSVLEKESQLYGAFDGAMKFIKGDAIAGIIIIFVNFIGGISVGMSQHGMNFSDALSIYTILTIGDGLVGQIPALLISISAGFIVTRVGGDGASLGKNIMGQLFANPFVLLITAILSLAMGVLPGFPLFVFVILASLFGTMYFFKTRALKQAAAGGGDGGAGMLGSGAQPGTMGSSGSSDPAASGVNFDRVAAETIPLMFLVPKAREKQAQELNLGEYCRDQFFIDYGVRLPSVLVRGSEALQDNQVVVLINEIRADVFHIYYDHMRVINYRDEIENFGMEVKFGDSAGSQVAWVSQEHTESLSRLGYILRSVCAETYHSLAALLARNVNEYFGVQEAKNTLDKLETKYPDLLKEVYRHATIQRISEVLQRLLSERISIRNMKMILEALAHWAPREKDVISLVEHIRGALARYICHKFSVANELRAIVISAEVEETIRRGIRQTSSGSFLNLEPHESDELLDLFSLALKESAMAQKDIVILCSVDVRRYIKKMLEPRFKELDVLSFGELTDTVSVNVIRTI